MFFLFIKSIFVPELRIRIRDPVLFDPWIRDPGWTSQIIFPRVWKLFLGLKRVPESFWMNIPDYFYESLETFSRVKKRVPGIFLVLDPGSGMKKFGSGITFPGPQHWFLPNLLIIQNLRHVCGESGCGKGFNSRFRLVQHQRTHNGSKPFQCPLCPYDCSRRDNLRSDRA